MASAVRPLGSLSMARGCARIDAGPDTAKIGSADRVQVITPGYLQLLGYEKRFHTAWTLSGSNVVRVIFGRGPIVVANEFPTNIVLADVGAR